MTERERADAVFLAGHDLENLRKHDAAVLAAVVRVQAAPDATTRQEAALRLVLDHPEMRSVGFLLSLGRDERRNLLPVLVPDKGRQTNTVNLLQQVLQPVIYRALHHVMPLSFVLPARDRLLQDMASWGQRHVFGNVPHEQYPKGATLPFLPLGEVYVEPLGKAGEQEPTPILALLEGLVRQRQPRMIVVEADFGNGKSLTARTLACRWARSYLDAPGLDKVLPVYVRCADDFPAAFGPEEAVRRAWRRQTAGLGNGILPEDLELAQPGDRQRTVFLFDGLDEVTLGHRGTDDLFEKLAAATTELHRFIVFTRPAAMPSREGMGSVQQVEILPLEDPQIRKWLKTWKRLSGAKFTPSVAALKRRELLEQARTPILLFMIAQTWKSDGAETGAISRAQLYEEFFRHVARGKHEADPEVHQPMAIAARELLAGLREEIGPEADVVDAMLWLLERLAWVARKIDPAPLDRRHLSNLIAALNLPSGTERIVELGLLLTLQRDIVGGNDQIHFGHQSFYEFLVGRYWGNQLHKLVHGRERDWPRQERALLGGRLLDTEQGCLRFLMEMINSDAFHWTNTNRQRLIEWAQGCFENEGMLFEAEDVELRNDLRPVLREAALAIGSSTHGSQGLKAKNILTLRSMTAWFWLHKKGAIVIAPKLIHPGAILDFAVIAGTLAEADLAGADILHSLLANMDLSGANLSGADFGTSSFLDVDLKDADLSGTKFGGVRYNAGTKWPEGFNPQAAGAKLMTD